MPRADKRYNPPQASRRPPTTGTFVILLLTIWSLNLVDTFQTAYLKEAGFLALEANYLINYFLEEGHAAFFGAKILALILITSMLVRGWVSRRGMTLAGITYPPEQVRQFIVFLLFAGVFYYVLIVGFPFVAMTIAGQFSL